MLELLESADRSLTILINQGFNSWLDPLMIFWSGKLVWIPLYAALAVFLFVRFGPRYFPRILLLMGILILLSDQTASALFKPLFQRLRPCHDPGMFPILHLPDGCGGQFGFASSHAANTMSLTVFFFLLPVFSRSKSIALALLVWAIITGWSRIYLGAHFAGDIIAGYAIGAFWAATLHFLARKISWFGLDGKNLIQTGK